MLWVDKHRPHSFDKFLIHKSFGEQLQKVVAAGDCPHMLFYGLPGAGKKTIVMCLLREMFGPGVAKLRVEHKPWKIELPTRKLEVELTTVSSNYHIELNPSDVGNNDRYVVQEIIKEMAKTKNVDPSGARTFKVLVLDDVDSLTREAQHALRRTMEKYSAACRTIMLCNNLSRVLEPVRSRCLCVRVPAPSLDEVQKVLLHVAAEERLHLPAKLAARVAFASQRNLRKALLALEACKAHQYPFTEDQEVQLADWELYVAEIAELIIAEQTPKRLYEVRSKIYELLINCIPGSLVLKTLALALCRRLDDQLKGKVAEAAAMYEHRLCEGSKDIFHIEAFVARVMTDHKKYLEEMVAM